MKMKLIFKSCLLVIVIIVFQIAWTEASYKYIIPIIKKGIAAAGLAKLGGKRIIPIPIPIPFEFFPPPVIGPPKPPPFLPPQPVVIGIGKGYGRFIGPGGFGGAGHVGGGGWGGHGGGFGGGFGGGGFGYG